MSPKTKKRNLGGFYLIIFIFSAISFVSAQEPSPAPVKVEENTKQSPAPGNLEAIQKVLVTDQKAVKEIEKKEEKTKAIIAKNEEKVEAVQKKAEEALAKKEELEKIAAIKKEEAQTAKEELETVKQEAVLNKNPEVLKKAKQLTQNAERLEKEADILNKKAGAEEKRAETAQQVLDVQLKKIEELKAQLTDLSRAKSAKRGLVDKLIAAGYTLAIGLVLFLILHFGIKKFEEIITEKEAIRESESALRLKTLSKLFRWMGSLGIIGFLIYALLEHFGINMAPLLAGAGIAGVAVGFGGQYLIRDIINGIFILVEGQYRINDVVKIGDHGGLVEDVNLRITRLRDLEGRVIYIPNGEVKTVINFTKEYAQALMDIGVAYKENVDQVMKIMKDIAKGMRQDAYFGRLILDDMEMLGVDSFSDSAVIIKCRIKTLPIKQWEVMREYRRRLKNRFDEVGIEIPFPHTTLYWGTGRDNDWWREKALKK
ncbi:MAG: mechanosensitive ion channel [Candidatus Omnitrophica bacterium]|nr:mechanosensitive ion channel [Candidatus Omnitrophota bacterium]